MNFYTMKRGILIVLLFMAFGAARAQQQGEIWGTSYYGGYNNRGAIFSLSPDAGQMKLRYSFPTDLGGGLTQIQFATVKNRLYGLSGTSLFEWDPVTNIYISKFNLADAGLYSYEGPVNLTEFKGSLYGMLSNRSYTTGSILEWNLDSGKLNTTSVPDGGTFMINGWFTSFNGKLYGVTSDSAEHKSSIIFEWEPATKKFTKKIDVSTGTPGNGYSYSSRGPLVVSNGKFYGVSKNGGKFNQGRIFEWDPVTNVITDRAYLGDTNQVKIGNTSVFPFSGLTLASNGSFYGITSSDTKTKRGTVFEWVPGSNTVIKRADLVNPNVTALVEYNGYLYGATQATSDNPGGALFRLSLAGDVTTLHEFSATGEYSPRCGISVINNKLYSATFYNPNANGALFEYDLQKRSYRKMQDIGSKIAPAFPIAELCYKDGRYYGASKSGQGSLYEFDPLTDSLRLKYTFTVGDSGYAPYTGMTLVGGKLYGLTRSGGKNNTGVLYEFDPAGSRYRKAADLPASDLFSMPYGGTPLAKDGKIYFTTWMNRLPEDSSQPTYMTRSGIFEFNPQNNALVQKAALKGIVGKMFLYRDSFYIQNNGDLYKWETGKDSVTLQVNFPINFEGPPGLFGGKVYALTGAGIYEGSLDTRKQVLKKQIDSTTGTHPIGGFVYNNGKFYGMMSYNGKYKAGTIVEYDPATNTLVKKQDFDYTNGYHRDQYSAVGGSNLVIAGALPTPDTYIKILSPLAGDTIHKPNAVRVNWTDKMAPSLGSYTYPADAGKRAYSYRIDYLVYTPSSTGEIGTWVPVDTVAGEAALNTSINLVSEFKLDTASKYSKVRVIDNYLPLNEVWSGSFSNIADLSGLDVKFGWDRTFPASPLTPVGVAADGTGSIFVKVKRNKDTDPKIRRVSVRLYSATDASAAMLGKVKAIYGQSTPNSTAFDQARNTADYHDLQPYQDSCTFMYVAPDDFANGNTSPYATLAEREVTLRFTTYYWDASVDSSETKIKIVRPPLMLVHGLASNEEAWNSFSPADGTPFIYNNLYKIKSAIRLSPHAAFSYNARMLLGINQPGDQYWFAANTLQGNIQAMRNLGYACNQVDYICHSMGGAVLRTAAGLYAPQFTPLTWHEKLTYYNYRKGFVHKAIFINTPHNGSPVADALTEFVPQAEPLMNSFLWGWRAAFPNTPYVFDFIEPSAPDNIAAAWRSTAAVYDLQASAATGGKPLGQTDIANHLVAGDIDLNVSITPSILRDLEPYFELLDEVLKIVRDRATAQTKPYLTGLMALNKTARVFGFIEWYSAQKGFPNFLADGDAIVPLKSQLAGQAESTPNTTIFKNSSFLNANHTGILGRNDVGEKVRLLLNSPVASTLFSQKIPANPGNNGREAPPKVQTGASQYRHQYDTSKIRIIAPVADRQLTGNEAVTISFRLKDTVGLAYTDVAFQFTTYAGVSRNELQQVPVTVKPAATGRQLIVATAVYDRNGETESHSDTLSVTVGVTGTVSTFRVSPEIISLRKGEQFTPQLEATIGAVSNDVSFRDPALSITLSDSSLLYFNQPANQFIALAGEGSPYAVFTYRDRKDTLQFRFSGNNTCDITQRLINVADTLICGENNIALVAPSGFRNYLWSDGSTGPAIQSGRAGRYWVQVTDSLGCTALSDIVQVNRSPAKPVTPAVINGDPNSVTGKKSDFSISPVAGAGSYKWTLSGGGAIESGNGTTGIRVAWTTPGKYKVWVQAQNLCGISEARQFDMNIYSVITATDDIDNDFVVQVAPNPATTHSQVTVKGVNGAVVQVELATVAGRRVYFYEEKRTGQDYSHKVPMQALRAGVYVLKLTIGKQAFTEKIIKL